MNFNFGDNALCSNSVYERSIRDDLTGEWSDPIFYAWYRELDTGEVHMVQEVNPKMPIYFADVDYIKQFKTQRAFLPLSELRTVMVEPHKVIPTIYKEIKKSGVDTRYLQIHDNATSNKQKGELHKHKMVYNSDRDFLDYTSKEILLRNNPKTTVPLCNYLDIEVDIYGIDDKDRALATGERPITGVVYVTDYTRNGKKLPKPKAFLYLLIDPRFKGQTEIIADTSKFKERAYNELIPIYGDFDIVIEFYDEEIPMLRDLFSLIHYIQPDWMRIYNMHFDINYFINRLQYLGENPANYFNDPSIQSDYFYYYYDAFNAMIPKKRTDYFDCVSHTKWTCQMLDYAKVRGAKSDYGGNSLDNVAFVEMGIKKREYDAPNVDVTNGAIYEYENFVLYTLVDGLLIRKLDMKTRDNLVMFDKAYYAGCHPNHVRSDSKHHRSFKDLAYLQKGLIRGNNLNKDYFTPFGTKKILDPTVNYDEERLAGALVADGNKNYPNGEMVNGTENPFYMKYIIDFDYTAYYPNTKRALNLASFTSYGRLILLEPTLRNENPFNDSKFSRGGKFNRDLVNKDWGMIARHFNIIDITDAVIEVLNDLRA